MKSISLSIQQTSDLLRREIRFPRGGDDFVGEGLPDEIENGLIAGH